MVRVFRLNMTKFLLFAFLSLVATTDYNAQQPTKSSKVDSSMVAQKETIDFEFTDLSGKSHQFSEFRGKIVLLDFWATWCAPCLADIPKLKAVYEKHKNEGFEIIGLNVETIGDDDGEAPNAKATKENLAHAKQIALTRKIIWTIATSETSVPVATKIFGIEALPAKILIDKDGKIIAVVSEKDDLETIVEKLLTAK